MRIALMCLLVVHALIHLLGFLKTWQLVDLPQLRSVTLFEPTAATARSIGALWLVVSTLLLIAAALSLARAEFAWLYLAIAVAMSQLLILHAWSDAKAGTLVNLLLVVPIAIGAAHAQFAFQTDRIVQRMFLRAPAAATNPVEAGDLAHLPAPVQHWLTASGVLGKAPVRSVRLKQTGDMRTSARGAWMPTRADQYFTVTEPGFVWQADVTMGYGLSFSGRDSYVDGKGRMLIKALGLWPIVDASDDKIQQGTLLRFLGEAIWFPSAALSPYMQWEGIDASSARATITQHGVSASGVFAFDDAGRVTRFSAQRYMGSGASAKLERWVIPLHDWKVLGGTLVPTQGDVVWKLAGGDFDYYRFKIERIEYDQPHPYSKAHSALPANEPPATLVSANTTP